MACSPRCSALEPVLGGDEDEIDSPATSCCRADSTSSVTSTRSTPSPNASSSASASTPDRGTGLLGTRTVRNGSGVS